MQDIRVLPKYFFKIILILNTHAGIRGNNSFELIILIIFKKDEMDASCGTSCGISDNEAKMRKLI